ncbi:MAG: preprotein translocase subunit SecA, partial [Spirochaetota bacterium]
MSLSLVTALFGSKHQRDLKNLLPLLHKINEYEKWAISLSPPEFQEKTNEFKQRYARGESLDSIIPEAFALVREAATRTLGERLFDVQLLGGIVLHRGMI